MRLLPTLAATALAASTTLSVAAAMPAGVTSTIDQATPNAIEKVQYYYPYAGPTPYAYGGYNYCWYPNGWHGPGWYWCGYGWRTGYGWGGPWAWGWGRGWGRGWGWHGGWRR